MMRDHHDGSCSPWRPRHYLACLLIACTLRLGGVRQSQQACQGWDDNDTPNAARGGVQALIYCTIYATMITATGMHMVDFTFMQGVL